MNSREVENVESQGEGKPPSFVSLIFLTLSFHTRKSCFVLFSVIYYDSSGHIYEKSSGLEKVLLWGGDRKGGGINENKKFRYFYSYD